MTLEELRSTVLEGKGKRSVVKQSLEDAEFRLKRVQVDLEAGRELKAIIQKVAQDTQNRMKVRFETIVQSSLDAVFPGEYVFRFEFIQKRGQTEVDMWLDSDGKRLNPLDSNGGGVVDVLSIALRLCCLTLSGNDKVLILDEPTPHLRGEAKQRLGELLSLISKKLGVQVVTVLDVGGSSEWCDKVFEVSKHSGITQTRQMEGRR